METIKDIAMIWLAFLSTALPGVLMVWWLDKRKKTLSFMQFIVVCLIQILWTLIVIAIIRG